MHATLNEWIKVLKYNYLQKTFNPSKAFNLQKPLAYLNHSTQDFNHIQFQKDSQGFQAMISGQNVL